MKRPDVLIARLREIRDFVNDLLDALEYMEELWPAFKAQERELLSVRETADLVTGVKRKADALKLLGEYVSYLDARAHADPLPLDPFGLQRFRRIYLLPKFRNNEPFWSRLDCLSVRPNFLEWRKNRPESRRGRKPKKL